LVAQALTKRIKHRNDETYEVKENEIERAQEISLQ
jgi:hypothetical protein